MRRTDWIVLCAVCCVRGLLAVPPEAVLNVVDTNRASFCSRAYKANDLIITNVEPGAYNLEQLPANMPYQFVVLGPDSDIKRMRHLAAAVTNAMPKDVLSHCLARGVLCPILQWILRRNVNGCETEKDYLTYKAHPWAFKVDDFRQERLVRFAAALTVNALPPVIKVKPIFGEYTKHPYVPTIPLLDYPDMHKEIGINELMGISVVLRAPEAKRVFRFYAKPFNGEQVQYEYKWDYVNRLNCGTYIRHYLGGKHDGYRPEYGCAEVELDWRRMVCRVDLAVFARKQGGPFGPPAIVSFYRLPSESRTYVKNGDIESIQYEPTKDLDFLSYIYDAKNWTDYYTVDENHDLFSLSRYRPNVIIADDFFYPSGERIKIFENVDWPCAVFRNYSPVYLTCRNSLEGAFTWLFDNEDRGIILEDDCVPEPTFFRFCGELLEKYKNDNRVGMISGHDENLRVKQLDISDASYYFDRLSSIWGWATWRRAWRKNDMKLSMWPSMRDGNLLKHVFYDQAIVDQWTRYYDDTFYGRVDTWDNGWMLTVLRENWLVAHPRVNLISNFGCGKSLRSSSTGTSQGGNPWDRRPVEPMRFPLVHPLTMIPNIVAERWTMEDVHLHGVLWKHKIKRTIKRMLHGGRR